MFWIRQRSEVSESSLDDSNESVGKKIREAEVMKVPYTVVIGGKEVESGTLERRAIAATYRRLPRVFCRRVLHRLSDDIRTRK